MDPLFPIFKAIYTSALRAPDIKLKLPSIFEKGLPKMLVFVLLLASYFVICSGIVYDMINEPPSIGSRRDADGRVRPVAVLEYRLNAQYVIEGFSAGFLFTIGGLGFISLNWAADPSTTTRSRYIFLGLGIFLIIIAYNTLIMFLKMKITNYLQ
ncbi:predicted protein [Naegleria gruberi]|uniref:Predicted protein n=1 Tax=Naegleria gruberi TaxID=5762 RepID=D2VUT1_NAEGR|nr:uncharacterized protein NAEGRDRAFT_76733 [Naegleria gruberi]XP_002672126.1 uncharacterized protein NAEGRDRAFT_72774 [Naegleria gruberi]EFC35611.1 predicted protein [Naegleria gruberi]EFC39382.1 predicted protein [Naegleria gruberi]|eukprot:XP_002668355.1 predicted protein [Naegleria gruberi strain NEG-M]